MEESSTTGAANNQDDQQTAENQTDSNAATDTQTADDGDNLDTSKSTDTSGDDDTSNDGEEETPALKFDDDLDTWAEKTGRKVPENDSERAHLQGIRDNQREYSRNQQAKKDSQQEVNKAIQAVKPEAKKKEDGDDVDPFEERLNTAEARLAEEVSRRVRSEYFSANDVSAEEAKAMGEILKEKTEKGGKTAFDYWTNPDNIQDWHELARARIAKEVDTDKIKEEAARSERERIAREHQANGPGRNASKTTTSEKTEEQARLERFSNWD